MRKTLFALTAALTLTTTAWAQTATGGSYAPSEAIKQAQQEFQDSKFGIFIHWGIYSMLGDGEWVMNNKKLNYEEYTHLAGGFCPSKFDARAWVRAFKDAGARYVTFTSRHHDGFSMFKTATSPYNVVDGTPFKRDVVAELAQACHSEGLGLHLYYSHLALVDLRANYYPTSEKPKVTDTRYTDGHVDYDYWNAKNGEDVNANIAANENWQYYTALARTMSNGNLDMTSAAKAAIAVRIKPGFTYWTGKNEFGAHVNFVNFFDGDGSYQIKFPVYWKWTF